MNMTFKEMKIKELAEVVNDTYSYQIANDISNQLYDVVTRLLNCIDDNLTYHSILSNLVYSLNNDIEEFKDSVEFKDAFKSSKRAI